MKELAFLKCQYRHVTHEELYFYQKDDTQNEVSKTPLTTVPHVYKEYVVRQKKPTQLLPSVSFESFPIVINRIVA